MAVQVDELRRQMAEEHKATDQLLSAAAGNIALLSRELKAHTDSIVDKLPGLVVGAILERIDVGGARPLMAADVARIVREAVDANSADLQARLEAGIDSLKAAMSAGAAALGAPTTAPQAPAAHAAPAGMWLVPQYQSWSWGGRSERPIPADFVFPK